jgi:molybdate transport system substrate-binding protein
MKRLLLNFGIFPLLFAGVAQAAEVKVAVATNFNATLRAVAERFEEITDHRVVISPGSTGKLYAQILNGAPFDVFLAADTDRPRLLAEQGLVVGKPFGYAIGKLVVWTALENIPDDPDEWLASADVTRIAIANPRHAPYGQAAVAYMRARDIEERTKAKLVIAENVGQAFQFAVSANATAGLVAESQALTWGGGSWTRVPTETYQPLLQEGVQLSSAKAAGEFVRFLLAEEGARIIENRGYDLPANEAL